MCSAPIPTKEYLNAPFLKRNTVGSAFTLYCLTSWEWLSTLTLTKVTDLFEEERDSSWGVSLRQGPHHLAKKSTITLGLDLIMDWSSFDLLRRIILLEKKDLVKDNKDIGEEENIVYILIFKLFKC